jgi:hypothetical protein
MGADQANPFDEFGALQLGRRQPAEDWLPATRSVTVDPRKRQASPEDDPSTIR